MARNNTLATLSLIFGILSYVVLGFIGGIVAIILGVIAKKQIAKTKEDGRGMATAGIILGVVNVVLSIIAIVLFIAFFAIVFSAATMS